MTLEFEGFSDTELAYESLARDASGIELLSVRTDGEKTFARVFVPSGKIAHFERLIAAYEERRVDRRGRPNDHRNLIDTIQAVRRAGLRAAWTDTIDFPRDQSTTLWWEVWLPVRGQREAIIDEFGKRAEAVGMIVSKDRVFFPERTVLLAFGTPEQMEKSGSLIDLIAELRKAKETAEFFDGLAPLEQAEWVQALLEQSAFPAEGTDVPHVCVLDTGANRGHPLLGPVLAFADMHTVDPNWGTDDTQGHGTEMAGLAIYGDLTSMLQDGAPIRLEHRLESVKLLPFDGANTGDPQLHAYLTTEAVSRPEVRAPNRPRVFSMAVTSQDNRDRGRPTAWSAAVDSLAADDVGEGENPRLIVVSAGNAELNGYGDYPASNTSDGIHDPGQAWNALTVGSSTELIRITEAGAVGYQPVASLGGLSPFSTTSATWQSQWPLKPDVLFEGGNLGRDVHGALNMASLSLLTSHARYNERLLTQTRETSASAALASRMAARLMAAYPNLRPETIRALMVHSANWTDEMRRMYLTTANPTKAEYERLVRHCGFGIPNLERALWSVSNAFTLVVEERLHPFERQGSGAPKLRDMHLHTIPWPKAELEALGDIEVQMRVTLSYFIEPNPSARAGSRYSYQSHGLRFQVKRALESVPAFRSRINRKARDEEEGTPIGGGDPDWLIGETNRHRGSIHSDIWKGTAVDLASRGVIAVYPALGWWKTRQGLKQYDRAAPYSLVVSINTPPINIDLCAAIENAIAIQATT